MDRFYINPQWSSRLRDAGLDSLDRLLSYRGGQVVSQHPRRGRTCRTQLPDGSTVFVKTDNFTYFKQVCKDLLAWRWPAPNSVREREAYALLAAHCFLTPEVIAWWTRSHLGYPGAAGMICLPVPGVPLDRYLHRHRGDPQKCQAAIDCVAAEFDRMLGCGFDWPDHKPEHFFVSEGDPMLVSIIDLERMSLSSQILPSQLIARRLADFRRLCAKELQRHEEE